MSNARPRTSQPGRLFEPLESRQMFSAGAIDTTFGHGGTASNLFAFASSAAAVQADDKTVIAGTTDDSFAVGRLNADGTVDKTFGVKGTAQAGLGNTTAVDAVAVQSDGKILVAGTRVQAHGTEHQWVLVRYTAAGQLDNTFGTKGVLPLFGYQPTNGIGAIALQSDGKILVTGDLHPGGQTNANFFIARLNTNGSLDTTFGAYGGTHRVGSNFIDLGGDNAANAITIQPDGKILLAGFRDVNNHTDSALMRFNTNGTLDTTFNHTGSVITNVITDSWDLAVGYDPHFQQIYTAGYSNGHVTVFQYNSSGAFQSSFAEGGFFKQINVDFYYNKVNLMIPSPGKIIITGQTETAQYNNHPQWFATEINTLGQLVNSFGTNGTTTIDADDYLTGGAAVSSDGTIVFAGQKEFTRVIEATPIIGVVRETDGIEGSTDGEFLLSRDDAYYFTTHVKFTVGGTATPGQDYTGPLVIPQIHAMKVTGTTGVTPVGLNSIGTFDISPGVSLQAVPVHVVDDSIQENTETVVMNLVQGTNYNIDSNSQTATISIFDNDGPLHRGLFSTKHVKPAAL